MNLILFERGELEPSTPYTIILKAGDARFEHIKKILKAGTGSTIDIGLTEGPRGKAGIEMETEDSMLLSLNLDDEIPRLYPLNLIIGTPRPQTVRKLLREITSLGAERFIFTTADKGERSYLASSALKSEETGRMLREGAQQAFCTRLPEVLKCETLTEAIEKARNKTALAARCFALDNYEATVQLSAIDSEPGKPVILAIGPERGWSDRERALFRAQGFTLASLGDRVLRTETAAVSGTAVCLMKMGLL